MNETQHINDAATPPDSLALHMTPAERLRLMPESEVRLLFGGISHSTLWRLVRAGDFPRPLKISKNRRGYRAGEVFDALAARQTA